MTTFEGLRLISATTADLVERHRDGSADITSSASRLRSQLEHSLDLLLGAATDGELDEAACRRLVAARDAIASHLRAADDVIASGARPSVGWTLLARGAVVLSGAIDPESTT